MGRWDTTKPKYTAADRKAQAHVAALKRCSQGQHHMSATFRPGEQVCLTCGIVIYCPGCLREQNLQPLQQGKAYALECSVHEGVQVSS